MRNQGWRRVLAMMLVLCLCLSAGAAGASSAGVLKNGTRSSAVRTLQQALTALGYSLGTPDGVFGSKTESAVRAFQQANGLTVDGKAGPDTQTLLYQLAGNSGGASATTAPSAPTTPPTSGDTSRYFGGDYSTIESGDRGVRVMLLQSALNALGYACGNADGVFGSGTLRAVKRFQGANGLTADGKAGTRTLQRMEVLLSSGSNTAPTAAPTPTATANPGSGYLVPSRILRAGYTGEDVRSVQLRLTELRYYTGTATAVYDDATMAAVRLFQLYNGLVADGTAGSKTYAVLYAATAIPNPGTPTTAPTPVPTEDPGYIIPTRILRAGYTGEDVRSVQLRLTELGYYTGTINATYDASTIAAVRAFQRRNGLTVDGLAGSGTNSRLFSASALPAVTSQPTAAPTPSPSPTPTATTGYTVPTRTLRSGSSGDDVATVQRRLTELGYYTTTVTGEYGTATVAAVTAFQQQNGLSVDGVAGRKTYQILFSAAARPAPSPTAQPTASPTQTATSYPLLKSGSKGDAVTALQNRLKALGYTVNVNGTYDATTTSAVKSFQTNNYLTVDGLAGNETQTILYSDAARTASQVPDTSYKTLDVNTASGTAALVTLQNRLAELGYPVTLNGKYDGTTHNAVVAFQQRNNLVISGIANGATQAALYASTAKSYATPVNELPAGTGWMERPSNVQLLWWYDEVKVSAKSGQNVLVYDPETGLSWNIKLYSLGHHADSQPASWQDTQIMNRSFGKTSWDCHPVFVKLPDGRWTLAAMHNYPHLYGSISNNGFGGHLCIHFLREYSECIAAGDSNYGVQMQDAIRKYWKAMTGITVE